MSITSVNNTFERIASLLVQGEQINEANLASFGIGELNNNSERLLLLLGVAIQNLPAKVIPNVSDFSELPDGYRGLAIVADDPATADNSNVYLIDDGLQVPLINADKCTDANIRNLPERLVKAQKTFWMTDEGMDGFWEYNSSLNDSNCIDDGGLFRKTVWGGYLQRKYTGFVNASWFGCNPDCSYGFTGTSVPVGTDNTSAFQKALYNTPIGGTLFVPKGQYLFLDKIINSRSIIIECEVGTKFIFDLRNKNKSGFEIYSSPKGKTRNLEIYGCGYLVDGAIEFKTPDNQAYELDSVKATGCRYGLLTRQSEVINRLVVRNCDFSSNAISGTNIQSFTGSYAHSAPITYENTIHNSNGPQSWMYSTQYAGQNILTTEQYGYQIYVKGFSLFTYNNGQISNHAQAKNIAMAYFDSGNGLGIYGTDIEDFTTPVRQDGTAILSDFSNIQNADEGGAVVIKSVQGVDLNILHTYQINTQSLIKLLYDCGDCNIELARANGTCLYNIDVQGANNPSNTVRLYTTCDLSKLSANAIRALNFDKLTKLEDTELLAAGANSNTVWNKFQTNGAGNFTFGYLLDSNNPNFQRNGLWIEKEVSDASMFYCVLECTQASFETDGKFFIETLDSSKNRLSYSITSTKGVWYQNGRYYTSVSKTVESNAYYIRYGFTNIGNYNNANIPSHATVKRMSTFLYSKSRNSGATNIKPVSSQLEAIKNKIFFNTNSSLLGTFEEGAIILNTNQNAAPIGWRCKEAGTNGSASLTLTGTGGDNFATASNTTSIKVGQYLNINFNKYLITSIEGTTVYFNRTLVSSVTNVSVDFFPASFHPIISTVAASTTLVAGTKTIPSLGVLSTSIGVVTLKNVGGTVASTWQYQLICSADLITINALKSDGTINTLDTSIVNYNVTI